MRIGCVLLTALLSACGDGGAPAGAAGDASPAPDSRLELDATAWDQGDWAP